jgi:hypothetical protein
VVKSPDYEPRIQVHYNVHFKDGSKAAKVLLRAISGLRPVDIDWIWIVEERRRAAPSEIRKLCKLSHEII